MTAFTREQQPRDSLVSIVLLGNDTAVLVLPKGRYLPALVSLGLAVCIIVFVACSFSFDPAAFESPRIRKLIVLAIIFVLLAVGCLFGRYRLVVTPQQIDKSLRLFGMNIPFDRARFSDVTDIVCDRDKFGPTLVLPRSRDKPFFIEGFSSPEERDWIAEALRTMRETQIEARRAKIQLREK
jgi:hypothetical protein